MGKISDYGIVYVCKKCETIYTAPPLFLCGKCGELQDSDSTRCEKRVGRRIAPSWWRRWFFGAEASWEFVFKVDVQPKSAIAPDGNARDMDMLDREKLFCSRLAMETEGEN